MRFFRWCCTAPEIIENNYQAAYVQDVKKVGGETKQGELPCSYQISVSCENLLLTQVLCVCNIALAAQDKYLAQALWELSERIIKDKVGQDALTSWDR